jgi:DNA-directed RNA polymerase subunit alpha
MKKFQKTNITSNTNNNKGNFTIKPLEKGFGITLGNSLRRILLSNIPGASMFAVKIKGVKHEFEAIPGIKEDATQLILNLKNLAIKMNGETYSDEDIESLKLEN